MELVYSCGLMADNTMAIGKMENKRDQANTGTQEDKQNTGFGKLEREQN